MDGKSRDRGHILWADDEIALLKPHILFLEERGYEVTAVHSGEDAIHEVASKSFDLILLDEMMDGMDGLKTLSELAKSRPGIPVIMITKNEEEWLMNEAIAANISGYLTKPVNPSQILMAAKSVLEKTRIRSDDTASRYLQKFQELGQQVDSAESLSEWINIFEELTQWDVEFDEHPDLGLGDLLAEQHLSANQRFGPFVIKNYQAWIHGDHDVTFSHEVLDKHVQPELAEGKRVIFIVVDCLRLDQWKAMRSILQDHFTAEETTHVSILPTATPYSRNALFSGLLPNKLVRMYPDEWNQMRRDETSMNKFEEKFLGDYLKRRDLADRKMKYFKIVSADQGQNLFGRLKEYKSVDLIALVVNFVDQLAHHRAESDAIKEMLPDESGYRKTICSWLEKSWMRNLLQAVSQWDNTVVILTSDHGSLLVDKAVRVQGDRQTSSGVRYKYGRNLNISEKEGLTIKKPDDFGLPADEVTTNFIIASDRNFFVYPTDYNRFVRQYTGSFQHGGVSLEEMIVPVIKLTPNRR